ncbi:Hypothetical protein SRAE_2000476950 [Strongyloides ratti]|uniref:Uncharacterized protein n=1 Tax=Strongyloides ratti TaxID=34506 RepID=A0A090LK92_STRRB|nr:Hypothetical protein SRAE_2000476950 [Strongyloides ratti]CEF70133.1 Hypothetical protein SRAE_2000476950 [Strongyloides ratti]
MNKQLILGLIITILLHLAFPICSLICDILQKYEKQSLTVRRTPALNRSCKSCSYIFFNIPEENFYGYILDCLSETFSYVNKYFHKFDKKKFEDNFQFVST